MLSDSILLEAGHPLWCSEYADEYESQGGSFGSVELTNVIDPLDPKELLPIMREYENKLRTAWKREPEEVFRLMGLVSDAQIADALYYTLMACRGHGVSLRDSYGTHLDTFKELTGVKLDTSPFNTEMNDLSDLAYEKLALEKDEFNAELYKLLAPLVEYFLAKPEVAKELVEITKGGCPTESLADFEKALKHADLTDVPENKITVVFQLHDIVVNIPYPPDWHFDLLAHFIKDVMVVAEHASKTKENK